MGRQDVSSTSHHCRREKGEAGHSRHLSQATLPTVQRLKEQRNTDSHAPFEISIVLIDSLSLVMLIEDYPKFCFVLFLLLN